MSNVHAALALSLLLSLANVGCGASHTELPPAGGDGGADSGVVIDVDLGGLSDTDAGTTTGDDLGLPPGDDAGTPPILSDGGVPTVMGGIGSSCADAADCDASPAGAMCITNLGGVAALPGGYCTAACTPASGSTECGAGSECFTIGFGGFGTSTCVKTCTTDAECRADEGYTCMAPPFGGGTTMYCLPPFGMGTRDGGFGFRDGGFGFGDGGFGMRDGGFPFPGP